MLNGTKLCKFSWVTRPNPVSTTGFPTLEVELSHLSESYGSNSRSSRLSGLLNPQKTRVNFVCDSVQVWVIRTIRLLVRKYLKGTKANVWDVKDILAVDAG